MELIVALTLEDHSYFDSREPKAKVDFWRGSRKAAKGFILQFTCFLFLRSWARNGPEERFADLGFEMLMRPGSN